MIAVTTNIQFSSVCLGKFEIMVHNEFAWRASSSQGVRNSQHSLSHSASTPMLKAIHPYQVIKTPRSQDATGSDSESGYARRRPRSNVSDRFIPSRDGLGIPPSFRIAREKLELRSDDSLSPSGRRRENASDSESRKNADADRIFSSVLRTELFGSGLYSPTNTSSLDSSPSCTERRTPTTPRRLQASRNLLTFRSPSQSEQTPKSAKDHPSRDFYSLSPVRFDSQKLLLSPQKMPRLVNKSPYKVLDAPELQDDFYLNLVDWGSNNQLAVGLASCVYLWNAQNSKVVKLCDLGPECHVTSVAWIQRGTHVAIGNSKGLIQIWDTELCKRIRTMTGHQDRVACLSWNEHILSSGGRDYNIFHRDVRIPSHHIRKLTSHKQEVCGLRWNCEDGQLASGGNDNKLIIWNKLENQPIYKFTSHVAAVKAIGWSPHQRGILASGGGTADRTVKFWNTLLGQMTGDIDTGSQVCNLAWSKNSNEIVTTHGFSENQIILWKYPSMNQMASLTGHACRVLYLSMSPDGQSIVTGAGDETLRFWSLFERPERKEDHSILDFSHLIR